MTNKRAVEAMIRSGAMDDFGTNRAVMMASMEEAVKTADQASRTLASGVDDMFGEITSSTGGDVYENFRHIKPWGNQRQLQEEKDSLGLWLSGHPIEEYLPEIKRMTRNTIGQLKAERETQRVIGLIHDMRFINSKRGGTIGIITLDDRSARIEASLFGEVFEQHRDLISKDAVVMVEGVVSVDEYRGDGSLQIRVKRMIPFQEARQQFARNITLNLNAEILNGSLDTLQSILANYRGPVAHSDSENEENDLCEIVVQYQANGVKGNIILGNDWRVTLDDDLLIKLRQHYGEQHIALNY